MSHDRMSLRDRFALRAMSEAMSDPNVFADFQDDEEYGENDFPRFVAEYAYQMADAMLAARGGEAS